MSLLAILPSLLLLLATCINNGDVLSHRLPLAGVNLQLSPWPRRSNEATSFLLFDRIRKAIDRARVETYVQDVNLQLQTRSSIERLLVVLELGEVFSRSFRDADGNRLEVGNSDKVSLPESILTQLTDRSIVVPWQFVIQKVHRCVTSKKDVPKHLKLASTQCDRFSKEESSKERVSCSSLDFRSNDSFIFLPRWMMDCMELKPYDLVYLSQIKLPEAIFVRLCPLEESFFNLDAPKAVLEEHLRHYSSLTRGAKIPITHEGVTYNIQVLRIETEDSKDVECASIQDLDVSIDLIKAP